MTRPRGTNSTTDRFEPRRVIADWRRWYVVQTRPQAEAQAAAELSEDYDVWLPRHWTVTVRRGRKVEVERLFFPGYLFAGGGFTPPRRSDNVLAVLGVDGPLAIPAGVVQAIADELTGNVKSEPIQACALLRIGEIRTVDHGPFRDFLARVTGLLANGRVKVEVGRMSVEIDPSMLGAA